MKCQKMKKYLYIGLSSFIVLYFSLCSCIGSYASTTDSGNSYVPIQQQWADNVYSNFQTVIQDSLKVAIPKTQAQQIWNDYVDHAYSIWNLEYDDLHQHYGHFREYVGAQFEMEKNSDNTYNYNMSEDAYTFIQDSYNTYVSANPLAYYEATITSYNFLNPSLFVSAQQFNSCKEFIKNAEGWVLIDKADGYSNMQGTTNLIVIPRQNMVDLVGTVSNGSFTSVTLYYNWSQVNLYGMRNIPNAKFYTMTQAGNITQGNFPNVGDSAITNGSSPVNNKFLIMSNYDKNERVYVFKNLNSLKNYNSGSAQPYYTMSGYTGIIDPTGYSMPNTNSSYESIVNNVQSGWTAQEVLALVDRIMSSGSSSGNGSGNGDNDSSGLWSRIGDAIGNLIDGIINVLTTVIEHLSDALLSVIHLLTGYTDDNGVVHEGLFGKLLNLVNSGFNNFLASIFSWLPEEIVTLFTAVLVFGIFFGLLKMLRR